MKTGIPMTPLKILTAFLIVQVAIFMVVIVTSNPALVWLFLVNLVVYVALLVRWKRREDREIRARAQQLMSGIELYDEIARRQRECDQE